MKAYTAIVKISDIVKEASLDDDEKINKIVDILDDIDYGGAV